MSEPEPAGSLLCWLHDFVCQDCPLHFVVWLVGSDSTWQAHCPICLRLISSTGVFLDERRSLANLAERESPTMQALRRLLG